MGSKFVFFLWWILSIMSKKVLGEISSPEFVLEPPSRVFISDGRGVTLRCAALGSPPPKITWVDMEGNSIQTIPGIREISINRTLWLGLKRSSATPSRESFRCKATNLAGTIISGSSTVMIVIPSSGAPRVEASPARVGGISTLQCRTSFNLPMDALTITWYQQKSLQDKPTLILDAGRFIYGSSGTLYILDVTQEDSKTRFQCRIGSKRRLTNSLGRNFNPMMNDDVNFVNSDSVSIRVLEEASTDSEPRIDPSIPLSMEVADGSSFTLPCIAYAKPPPKFSWTRDGHSDTFPITTLSSAMGIGMPSSSELWARGPILGTGRAKPNHQGIYNCIVANSRGSDRANFDLTVIQELKASILPQRQSVSAGGRAVIRCTVYGTPVVDVKWFRDGLPLVHYAHILVQGREIIIGGASERDVGVYQCIASNSLGEVQAASYLSIRESTPKLVHQFIQQTLHPGPAITLTCASLGHPIPSISWLRDGQPISSRSNPYSNARVSVGSWIDGSGQVVGQVNISSVTLMDGGLYECQASNRVGQVTHRARLNVHGPPSARAPANLTAINKREAVLPCPVTGYPLVDIQWMIDSRPITPTIRRFSKGDGTLRIRSVDSFEDSKKYSCTATNSQGLFATASFFLNVLNPPVLAEIKFPENLFEGMRLSVLCTLLEGDVPITIKWSREGGARIPQDPSVSQSHAHFYSNLVFMKVQGRHAGKYSCTASNSAASTSVSAVMDVKVPPIWVVEPENVEIVSGEDFTLECHAAGTPLPVVTWKKPSGDLSLADSPEVSGDGWRITIPRPGSLRIRAARSQDEGKYLCHAKNGIKPPLSKVIDVKVLEGARIDGRMGNHTVGIGGRLDMECQAQGQQPIFFSWSQNGEPFVSSSLPDGISIRENSQSRTSVVSLVKARRDLAAVYVCQAANAYGAATKTFFVNIVEHPDPPANVHVVSVTSRELTLSWTAPFDGSSPLTHYVVETWEEQQPQNLGRNVSFSAENTKATLQNLRPGTKYKLAVRAFNELGSSKPSWTLSISTKMEPPEMPPSSVKVMATKVGTLSVTWQESMETLQISHSNGYQVGYRVDRSLEDYTWRSIRNSVYSTELRHLSHFTTYEVVVRATNEVGMGPLSPPVKATTKQAAPSSPPLNVDCTPLSYDSIRVRWNSIPVNEANGPIQGYKVFYKKISNLKDFSHLEPKTTTNLETNLQELQPFTNYSLKLLAYNAAGDGVLSNSVSCTTLENKPGPPASLKALTSGPNTVIVCWLPPLHANGIITHYTLYYRLLNSQENVVGHTIDLLNLSEWEEMSSEVTGLNENSHYEFWVTASTRVGEGTTSHYDAQKPTDEVAAGIKSFGQIVEGAEGSSLELPCNALGFPPPSVVWTKPIQTPDHSLRFSKLQKHNEGNYSCIAKNIHGQDKQTWLIKVVSTPPAPTLHLRYTTESSIELSWILKGDGGKTITGYVLAYRKDSSDQTEEEWRETEVMVDKSKFLLQDVECGNIYSLRILAVNMVGKGKFSKIITTRTRGSEPQSPVAADLITVNVSAIALHLYTWPTGGCPLKYFVLAYRQRDQKFTNPIRISGVTESYTIDHLTSMTWYDIKVTAVNSAGSILVMYQVGTSSPNGDRLAEQTIIQIQQIGIKVPAYRDPHVLAPIVSGVACTLALLLCISIGISRGSCCFGRRKPTKSEGELKESRTSLLFRKGLPRSHGSTEKLSPAARAKEEEVYGGVNEAAYEICPYASYDPTMRTIFPGSPQEIQTLDYSLQFQTFGHQECLEGPQISPGGAQSSCTSSSGWLFLKGKGNGAKSKRRSREIRGISNDQTLPVGSDVTSRLSRRSEKSLSVSTAEGTSEDLLNYTSNSEDYRIPIKLKKGSDFNFYHPESSTESNDEKSPQYQSGFLRNFIHQKNESSQRRKSNLKSSANPRLPRSKAVYSVESTMSSQESCVETPLRPPSGFLDAKEFSEAECDKDQSTHEQQKISKKKRHRNDVQAGSDYTIHV